MVIQSKQIDFIPAIPERTQKMYKYLSMFDIVRIH